MDPATLALFVAAFGPALIRVAEKLAEKAIIDPALENGLEQARNLVTRGYRMAKDAGVLADALQRAMNATDSESASDHARLKWDAVLGKLRNDPGVAALTIAAAVEMTSSDPRSIRAELLTELSLDERHRVVLALFLANIRKELLGVEPYGNLIRHADNLHQRNALRGFYDLVAGTITASESGSAIRARFVAPPDAEQEKRYLDYLRNSLGKVSLIGRDTGEGAASAAIRPPRLERVYIALNTKLSQPIAVEGRGERLRSVTLRPPGGEGARVTGDSPLSVLRAAHEFQRLVLLGDPGSGKSTFTRHLSLCLAGTRQDASSWLKWLTTHDVDQWVVGAPLPLLVPLKTFASSGLLPENPSAPGEDRHLLKYIENDLRERQFDRKFSDLMGHVTGLLEDGRALLICDGLDEIQDSRRRAQVAQAITDLAHNRFPLARMIVTCRTRQYPLDDHGKPTAEWRLPGFFVATLADFDRRQINAFVEHWFTELAARERIPLELAANKIKEMVTALQARQELIVIAQRPVVLTQMALVHARDKLPESTRGVYDECSKLLLWEWESLRGGAPDPSARADHVIEQFGLRGLKKLELEKACDAAAYESHLSEEPEIPDHRLHKALKQKMQHAGADEIEAEGLARRFINEWLRERNGLLVPATGDDWDVPHRTFREYMAARHLTRTRARHPHTGKPASFAEIGRWLVHDDFEIWREVYKFGVMSQDVYDAAASLMRLAPRRLPKAGDQLALQSLLLAGECARVVGEASLRGEDFGRDLIDRLYKLLPSVMTDPDLKLKEERYAAGEILDALGWLPDDLNAFVKVPHPPPSRAKREIPPPSPAGGRGRGPGVGEGFLIARYPVTNSQYELFLASEDYADESLWRDLPVFVPSRKDRAGGKWQTLETEGWEWFQKAGGSEREPSWWDDARFGRNRRGYPVVGVTWYEAGAYCKWLTRLLQRARAGEELPGPQRNLIAALIDSNAALVRLSTENEWELAAGGTQPEERYPWDAEGAATTDEVEIAKRANVALSIDGTSPVVMFPGGAQQPEGIMDLAGNVWEWQANYADDDHDVLALRGYGPALRGGAWNGGHFFARVSGRYRYFPNLGDADIGFRVGAAPGFPTPALPTAAQK